MGAYVTRVDPKTGDNREYYKADNGKLYNDYQSAVNANTGVSAFREVGNRMAAGADAALANVTTDPSPMNVARLVRDTAMESLPGDQRTSLDNPFGSHEGAVKRIALLKDGDAPGAVIQGQTTRTVGNGRERLAEHGRNTVLRKAGTVLSKKLPAIFSRTAAGSTASGGLLAPALATWGAYDLVDTGSQIITGESIDKHVARGMTENHLSGESTSDYYGRLNRGR